MFDELQSQYCLIYLLDLGRESRRSPKSRKKREDGKIVTEALNLCLSLAYENTRVR